MKNTFKKTVRSVHLWLGLTTGLVVFIVCITGSIYTFQKELKLALYPHYTVDVPAGRVNKLPLKEVVEGYKKTSNHKVLRVYDFTQPKRSTMLLTSKNDEYYFSFINPYTNKLLFEAPLVRDFFTIVLYIHMNLLLGELGTQIVGWSVIVFIISLISGLILWFPKSMNVFKSKKGRQARFGIKTDGSKKRLTYDLHNVLGFYGGSILTVIAITGVAWTFTWVDNALYTAVTFKKKTEEQKIVVDSTAFNTIALDNVKTQIAGLRENKQLYMYFLPQKPTDPLWVRSSLNDDQYGNTDSYYAHPETGRLIKSKYDEDKNAGQKLNSLYYDIHTGSILGITGKIVVFFAGLIGASLPVTGVMLYLNRRKKQKKKSVQLKPKPIKIGNLKRA